MKVYLFIIFLVVIGACKNNIKMPSSQGVSSEQLKVDSQYAKIIKVDTLKGETYIFTDFVQYLTGDKAVKAAAKNHDVDTLYEGGDTVISVPNDYYIVNDNPLIRRLALSKDVIFNLDLNMDRSHPINNNSIQSFCKIYKDSYFLIVLSDSVVVRINEVFMP